MNVNGPGSDPVNPVQPGSTRGPWRAFVRQGLRVRIVVTVSTIMAAVSLTTSAVTAVFLIPLSTSLAINNARTKVLALARLTQTTIDPKETLAIRSRQDEQSAGYLKLHRQLGRLVASVDGVGYAYIWRLRKASDRPRGFRAFWVVDNMPFGSKMFKPVGREYPLGSLEDGGLDELFETGKAAADKHFYTDYAGTWISGYAPIHVDPRTGDIDVVGIDISADYILNNRRRIWDSSLLITFGTALLMIPVGAAVGYWMCLPLKRIVQRLQDLASLDLPVSRPDIPAIWIQEIHQVSDALERLTAALSSFALYLPRDVVRKLLATNEIAKKGGTNKPLVILFTDIRNFTGYSESTSLDVLLPKLNQYLNQVSLQISERQGTIDKFIGDSVMAFWGAPSEVDQPAWLACKAALAIRQACESMNRQWQDEGLNLNFTTRIGIHAGNAIVGNFGSDDRINYTAIGDSVNLASRLESTNKEYNTDIIVSRSVVDAVQAETGSDPLIFDRIDSIRVRGKQQAVEIYSLRGFKEATDLNS